MAKFVDKFKEIRDVFKSALEHSEYECYKIKDDIVKLLNIANEQGYSNPIQSELSIKIVDKYQTIVRIDIYFDGRIERYQKFSTTLDLGRLIYVPLSISHRLTSSGEVKIALDTNDFNSLFVISTSQIRPEDDFEKLKKVTIRDVVQQPIQKQLKIKDRLFYYEVEGIYIFNDKSRCSRKLYIGHIKNIPSQVQDRIINDPDLEVIIDVTNI